MKEKSDRISVIRFIYLSFWEYPVKICGFSVKGRNPTNEIEFNVSREQDGGVTTSCQPNQKSLPEAAPL
jgi:hypothetical protein